VLQSRVCTCCRPPDWRGVLRRPTHASGDPAPSVFTDEIIEALRSGRRPRRRWQDFRRRPFHHVSTRLRSRERDTVQARCTHAGVTSKIVLARSLRAAIRLSALPRTDQRPRHSRLRLPGSQARHGPGPSVDSAGWTTTSVRRRRRHGRAAAAPERGRRSLCVSARAGARAVRGQDSAIAFRYPTVSRGIQAAVLSDDELWLGTRRCCCMDTRAFLGVRRSLRRCCAAGRGCRSRFEAFT